jgi:uncharacterized protein YndB with AHSA1/START domain
VTQQTMLEPVRATVTVDAPKERAFEVFTSRMTAWWPATYKIGRADLAEAIVEPRAGGRWYERDADGSECDWGRVVAYEPPDRLVLTWQIDSQWAFNPGLVTEVEVRFVDEGPDRTRVEVEHRNLERYGPAAEQMKATFESEQGWTCILRNFADNVAAAG